MVATDATSFPAVPAQDASSDFHRLSFTGSGKEYFGIWIVNAFLTIVTLGVYSAWAKVRRNRYFYGNTVLLGRAFEYHATGGQILIGRLIVLGYLILYNVMLIFVPVVGIILGLLLLVFVPFLVARGLRFSARVTSYRNVRFDFVGGAGGAFLAFIVGPVVAAISFGILAPLASRWAWRYIGSNMRYGDRAFVTEPRLADLYKTWALVAVMVVVGLLVFFFFASLTLSTLVVAPGTGLGQMPRLQFGSYVFGILTYLVGAALFTAIGLFYRAGIRNAAWSATIFDRKHRLLSNMSRSDYAWVVISGFVVTILTLGLMRPWVAVRVARYVNDHTAVRFNGNVGEIFDRIEAQGSAVGAEFMDIEGFDIGF